MARVATVFCLLLAVFAAAGKKRKSNVAGRIVGGRDTDIREVPYQVSLQFQNSHDCGGSLIGTKFVLTAAHCVIGESAPHFSIRAGSTKHASGGETRKVVKVTMHPHYDDKTLVNDIALLELNRPFTISNTIQTILLTDVEPKVGQEVLVSGWGALQHKEKVASPTLQSVKVTVTDKETCKKFHKGRNPVTDNMFCAGVKGGDINPCKGDSGGPAVVGGKLAGIISWGGACEEKNSPGVYTSVAKYRSWILTHTRSS